MILVPAERSRYEYTFIIAFEFPARASWSLRRRARGSSPICLVLKPALAPSKYLGTVILQKLTHRMTMVAETNVTDPVKTGLHEKLRTPRQLPFRDQLEYFNFNDLTT